jgi:hypothetical protein
MQLLTKTFSGDAEGVWGEYEASQIQILSWPDRDRMLTLEYISKGGRQTMQMRNPEPGMIITFPPSEGSPARVRLSTTQPTEELLSKARCILRVLVDPENLIEQPKQEVQGLSLTQGTSVVVPSVTDTPLGNFFAWRTGILRVVGTVSVDPTLLRFRLASVAGVMSFKMGDTGDIPHRKLFFEYSLKDDAGSYFVPVVHAGRQYVLSVEHTTAANISYDCDVYIEPVALS